MLHEELRRREQRTSALVQRYERLMRRAAALRVTIEAMARSQAIARCMGRPDPARGSVAEIAALLGTASRSHDVLYSTRILKNTGLRFG